MSLHLRLGHAEPAGPVLVGDTTGLRAAAQQQRRMGHCARRRERHRAELTVVPECVPPGTTNAAPSLRRSRCSPNAFASCSPSSPRTRRRIQSASASSRSAVCTSVSSTRRRRMRRPVSGSASTWRSQPRGSAATSAAPKFAMTCSRRVWWTASSTGGSSSRRKLCASPSTCSTTPRSSSSLSACTIARRSAMSPVTVTSASAAAVFAAATSCRVRPPAASPRPQRPAERTTCMPAATEPAPPRRRAAPEATSGAGSGHARPPAPSRGGQARR